MKHLNLIPVFLLFIHQADAQLPTPGIPPVDTPLRIHYGMFSVSAGMLFPRHPGRSYTANFQYTSTSTVTGATTTQTFTGSSGGFLSSVLSGNLIHGGYVTGHHVFDAGIGFNNDMNNGNLNAYVTFGYGYIVRIQRWQIQPAVDFYRTFDGPVELGNIDNNNADLSVLGHPAHSQFYSTTLSFDSPIPIPTSSTKLYNAGNLEVDYKRNSFLTEPKLLFGTFVRRQLYLGVEAGWMLQLAQTSSVKLTQHSSNGTADNGIGTISLSNNGSLGGPAVAFDFVWCFGGSLSRKKKH